MNDPRLPDAIGGLPNICGSEELIVERTTREPLRARYMQYAGVDFDRIKSAFANALHMHQPLVPAGGDNLATAKVISNLKWMMDHQQIGDNHNAPVFHWCYKRMGDFIPQLVGEGKNPKIMLEYSGCLLYGLIDMGLVDVIDNLRRITCDQRYWGAVEWLGTPFGHPVAPSTPAQDYRLHVQAFQHYFATLFGLDALERVRGFSPAEMALPNHPDVCYEFVRTLNDCGYRWVLVQEHTVERTGDGGPLQDRHLPHRLVAKNSRGETATITAVIKTQGSDTKLVAQGQPYYEAKGLGRCPLQGRQVPPLVTQIADGENGGVMMNEFPAKYLEVMREASGSETPALNVSAYLEYLDTLGITAESFSPVQPIHQQRIWDRFEPGSGPEALRHTISELEKVDPHFHMEGGSWTNDRSWVSGYEQVLGSMEEASALFHENVLARHVPTSEHRYRNALFHLLISQTSCYRYWGGGIWTDYGRELSRRTLEILKRDF